MAHSHVNGRKWNPRRERRRAASVMAPLIQHCENPYSKACLGNYIYNYIYIYIYTHVFPDGLPHKAKRSRAKVMPVTNEQGTILIHGRLMCDEGGCWESSLRTHTHTEKMRRWGKGLVQNNPCVDNS